MPEKNEARRDLLLDSFILHELRAGIHHGNLFIQGPQVVEVTQKEEASGAKPEDACEPFAHIHPVNPENAQKGQKDPSEGVVDSARTIEHIGLPVHAGDQDQVNDPTDEKKAKGEEINRSRDRAAVIEAMSACEAKDPEKISHNKAMGFFLRIFVCHGSPFVRVGAPMFIDPKKPAVQAENCPVCEGPGEFYYRDEARNLEYLACSSCATVFLHPRLRLSGGAERKRYEQHENDPQDLGYRSFLQPLVEAVREEHFAGQRGLDFGCGPTASLQRILDEGGLQMSAYDVFFHPHRELLAESYDFIVASEVFEHLYNPRAEMETLRRALRSNGALWIMTSVFEEGLDFSSWAYRSDPTHVIFYSPRALGLLAQEFGFKSPERRHKRVWKMTADS